MGWAKLFVVSNVKLFKDWQGLLLWHDLRLSITSPYILYVCTFPLYLGLSVNITSKCITDQ